MLKLRHQCSGLLSSLAYAAVCACACARACVCFLLRHHEVRACAGDKAEADISSKVDVIVTEIFDSQLLGEGILPTMRHAVQHLLKVLLWVRQLHSSFFARLRQFTAVPANRGMLPEHSSQNDVPGMMPVICRQSQQRSPYHLHQYAA